MLFQVIKLRYWYRESANLPEDPFALTLNLVLDFIVSVRRLEIQVTTN